MGGELLEPSSGSGYQTASFFMLPLHLDSKDRSTVQLPYQACQGPWPTPAPAIPQRWLQCKVFRDPTNLHPIQPSCQGGTGKSCPRTSGAHTSSRSRHPAKATLTQCTLGPQTHTHSSSSHPIKMALAWHAPGHPDSHLFQLQPSHQGVPSTQCSSTPPTMPTPVPAIPPR